MAPKKKSAKKAAKPRSSPPSIKAERADDLDDRVSSDDPNDDRPHSNGDDDDGRPHS